LGNSISDKKVGLALSGGAARGLAHIGVLETLEREGIPVDIIAGTSMGAIIGAMYARGVSAAGIKRIAVNTGWRELAHMFTITPSKTGLINGHRVKAYLKDIIGEVDFSELKIPFACVATDLITGEEVIIDSGSVLEGVIASISIPVIFKAAIYEGRYLVDGGVVNPLPVSVIRNMGASLIIASNVVIKPDDRLWTSQPRKGRDKKNELNIFNVMMQYINITSYQSVKDGLSGADVIIQPGVADIGFTEFRNARECVARGHAAAWASIPEIRRLLSGLSLHRITGV